MEGREWYESFGNRLRRWLANFVGFRQFGCWKSAGSRMEEKPSKNCSVKGWSSNMRDDQTLRDLRSKWIKRSCVWYKVVYFYHIRQYDFMIQIYNTYRLNFYFYIILIIVILLYCYILNIMLANHLDWQLKWYESIPITK